MKPARILTRCLFTLLMAVWTISTQALSTDKNQPVEIEADSVDLNESKGISIYQGNVELNQGSMRLQADKVTVFYQGSKPHKLVANGQPVKFRQLPDNSEKYVNGRGNRVEYLINSEELFLIDDAELSQGKDSFKSDRITYDRVKAVVKAGAAAAGKQRVKVTIQPKKAEE